VGDIEMSQSSQQGELSSVAKPGIASSKKRAQTLEILQPSAVLYSTA
jgi:hypothetical protein